MYSPIAITSPTVSSEPSTRPVYVYGKSGKCWRFRDESRIRPYFSGLLRGGVFEACEELVRRYGPTIADRLKLAFHEDRMEKTAIDPEVEHTDNNGVLHQIGPRAYKYKFPKANIELAHMIDYGERVTVLAALLDGFDTHITTAERAILAVFESRDVWDYLTGDRVVYSEPRATPQKPWFSWLFSNTYPVIDVDLRLKKDT